MDPYMCSCMGTHTCIKYSAEIPRLKGGLEILGLIHDMVISRDQHAHIHLPSACSENHKGNAGLPPVQF